MLFEKEYKYIVSCDLETNGLNPLEQWLTGSFGLLDFKTLQTIRELEVESRPDTYNEEAYKIHFIREEVAMDFPPRIEAIKRIIDFIPGDRDDFVFLCHANVNNFGAFYHFDLAVLKNDFNKVLNEYYVFDKYFNPLNIASTHTMARKLQKEGLVPRGVKRGLKELCKFYGIKFQHHNAKSDRVACEQLLRIFDGLEPDQLSLI